VIYFWDTEGPRFGRGRLAQRPVCSQWAIDDGATNLCLWRDFDVREALRHTLVGANLAYDMACAMVADPELIPLIFAAYDEGRVVDILLDAKLLDIAAGEYADRVAAGWNLQSLARRCGIRIEKDSDDETGDGSWRLRFAALDGIPIESWPAGAVAYATEEIPATRTIYREQQKARARWSPLDPLGYHSQHVAYSAFCLHLQQCQGVLTDPAAVEAVSRRVEAYLDRIRGRLIRAGLVRANGKRDTRAAAKAMVDACTKAQLDLKFTDGAEKKEREASEKLSKAYAAADAELMQRGAEARVSVLEKPSMIVAQWHNGVHLPGVQCDKDLAILSGSRVLELYAEYTGANLLRGRVDRMRQGYVLPLQSRFDALKETARTSSTQPADPLVGEQMQNFPRSNATSPEERKRERGYVDRDGVKHKGEYFTGLRECFCPRPGNVFVIADYSMAELHTVSQICLKLFGYSKLAELLNAGIDAHWYLAAITLGKTYSEVFKKEEFDNDRQRVKPGNFGFWGGMGAEKFVLYSRKGYQIRFTIPEAKTFKEQWRTAYPETRPYFDWIGRQLGDNDSFTHVHPITGFVRGGCGYTSGSNHGFQHLAAYGAKLALCNVTKACFDPASDLFGARPWSFVHDEIIIEVACEQAHEAAIELGRIMTETFNQFVPDVPTKAEPIVATRWSKKAKQVWRNERLVPWEPPAVAA
jgi:hypothetical protein